MKYKIKDSKETFTFDDGIDKETKLSKIKTYYESQGRGDEFNSEDELFSFDDQDNEETMQLKIRDYYSDQQKPSLISNIGNALGMGATPPLMGMGAAMAGEGQLDPLTQAMPKTREEQGRLLKGVQTGLGFTPISPLSEFVGETATSLIDGKTLKEALGKGATAAGTDLALRVALGGLPAGARKVLSPEWATKWDQGFARPIGKKLFGSSFTKRFRQEVVDEIVDRPELLTGTKRTVDDIGKELSEATKNYEMDTGKLIGEAKKNMDMKNVSVKIDDISADLFENSRKIAKSDESGKEALDIINKEINNLNKKGNIYLHRLQGQPDILRCPKSLSGYAYT